MFSNELHAHFSLTSNNDKKKTTRSKHSSSFKKKRETRKSRLLLSMPTKSEISLEKMISLAKIHSEANRPLIKIKDFDGQTKFCQCCSLPSKDDVYLRNCSFCENTDKFAEYGRGTSLYFSFFRFSIVIMIFCLLSMALPAFLLTANYTKEITDECKKIYDGIGMIIKEAFPPCLNYIEVEGVSYENTLDSSDWEFRYNSRNLITYKIIFKDKGGFGNKINGIIVNFYIMHFIGLLSLFVISILYIILLENINKQYDMDVTSPGDFTIIVSNLFSAFDIFWKKINIIREKRKKKDLEHNNTEESKSQEKTNYSQNDIEEMKEIGLEEIPKDEELNIIDAFNQFIKNKICTTDKEEKFKIYDINICYKIGDFMTKEEKIQEIKKEIYKINNEKFQIIKNRLMGLTEGDRRFFYNPLDVLDLNVCQGECCERYHVLSDIIDEKSDLEKELKELLEEAKTLTKDNFSGVIFVTFNTIEEHEKFMKPYPKNLIMTVFINIKNLKYFLCCCCVNKEKRKNFFLKRNITVEGAPEPEDVIFENLQCSSCERFVRTLFIYIFSLIVISICFVVILFLNYFQTKRNKKKGNLPIVKYGLSIAISLVISILNAIFQYILESLTKKEKQISMTNFYLSFSIKLTIFTFCTSAVIPLLSNHFFSKADYNLLVTNMLMLFITNAFLTPIMWTMNFEFLLKKIKICMLERNQETYTQKELNELYELLDMSIASKYSYIFKTLLMSFLYMPIFPLSIAISLVGFIFGYFLEKFNFSKMYKRPEILNSKICEFYSNYFPINFLMLTIGDFLFLNEEDKTSLWSIINVILFASLIIIPYNQIFDFDFIDINESQLTTDDYEECYFTFFNDYEKTNPITKKEGIKNFMLKLEKEGLISRSEYSKFLSNFDNANLMETYYKARKNIGNSMAQQNFVNMGKLSTIRKKTTKNRKKTILDSFRKLTNRKPGTIQMIIGDKKRKTTKKKSHEMDKDQIIEENEKESESNNSNKNNNNKKDINSFNLSLSNSDSIQETENNNINRSHNLAQKIQTKAKQNIQRRNNVFRMEDQEAIANLVTMYNNPILFGLKNLCENINSEDEESDLTESENNTKSINSRNEERKGTLSKSNLSSSKSIDFDNIKSVEEEPIVTVEKKPEEKVPKKMKMKIHIKKKIKVKKKIKIKIKVKKVQKKEPEINFNDYNFDWLNLINK